MRLSVSTEQQTGISNVKKKQQQQQQQQRKARNVYTRLKTDLRNTGVKTLTGLKCVRKESESEVSVKMVRQFGF